MENKPSLADMARLNVKAYRKKLEKEARKKTDEKKRRKKLARAGELSLEKKVRAKIDELIAKHVSFRVHEASNRGFSNVVVPLKNCFQTVPEAKAFVKFAVPVLREEGLKVKVGSAVVTEFYRDGEFQLTWPELVVYW